MQQQQRDDDLRLANLHSCPPSVQTAFSLHGVRNSRFSTFNQNSSNKEITTYDLHSCPPSMRTACQLRIYFSWRTEQDYFERNSRFSTFNQNSRSYEETTTYDSPISTRVRRPCELLLLFMEGTHLGHQNQKKLTQCEMIRIQYQHPPNPH